MVKLQMRIDRAYASRLHLKLAGVFLLSIACAPSSDAPSEREDPLWFVDAPKSWNRTVVRPTDQDAAEGRRTCRFKRGALPAETISKDLPVDKQMPVENIVILMQENRSFDTYFARLNHYAGRYDIEAANALSSNPENIEDPSSPRHYFRHAPVLCVPDTDHTWGGSHFQYNGGKMDGFFQSNHGFAEEGKVVPEDLLTGDRALWYFDERDIPFYYELASTFAIGDHYHADVLGPTRPNRDYLYAATSRGIASSASPSILKLPFPKDDIVIFDELEKRHVSWTIYFDKFPQAMSFLGPFVFTRWVKPHLKPLSSYFEDARKGKLPEVAFVDSGDGSETVMGNDEHPPGDIQIGQKFVSDAVHALFKSPQWKKSAMFIAYDEHGGLYDHVAPPPACPPDEFEPELKSPEDKRFPGRFDHFGARVPFILVSPFAKRSYVSHTVYSHASITRFIETKFKLPALTARDANADPMLDLFDFAHPPFLSPPKIVEATVDQERLETCKKLFGNK